MAAQSDGYRWLESFFKRSLAWSNDMSTYTFADAWTGADATRRTPTMKLRSWTASVFCLWLLQAFVVLPAGATAANANPPAERRIWMAVGERRFAVTLADNETAHAFVSQLPLTLDMPDLNGNEKHVRLPKALPTDPTRPGTIRNGDLMLWGADTLVVFYLTFDSPYSYSRVGRIEDAAALPQALGRGHVRVTFAKE